MLDSTKLCIEALGRFGFHAKYIQKRVKKYSGEEYSLATIYKTLGNAGVSLRDYRNGETIVARRLVLQAVNSLHTQKGIPYVRVSRPH